MEILVLLQFYERVMPLFNSLYTRQHYHKPCFQSTSSLKLKVLWSLLCLSVVKYVRNRHINQNSTIHKIYLESNFIAFHFNLRKGKNVHAYSIITYSLYEVDPQVIIKRIDVNKLWVMDNVTIYIVTDPKIFQQPLHNIVT